MKKIIFLLILAFFLSSQYVFANAVDLNNIVLVDYKDILLYKNFNIPVYPVLILEPSLTVNYKWDNPYSFPNKLHLETVGMPVSNIKGYNPHNMQLLYRHLCNQISREVVFLAIVILVIFAMTGVFVLLMAKVMC